MFEINATVRILSRPKLGGLLQHVGVELPEGRIAHCVPAKGAVITWPEEYAEGQDVTTIREVCVPHGELMQRLSSAITESRPYDPISWNCEVFASWLVGETPQSSQVNGLLAVGLVVAIARIAS